MTTINDLYFYRGELLDTAAEAAIQERPFYLQSSLDDINDQIRLLENVTTEAQAEYFRTDSVTDGRNEIEHAQIVAGFGKVNVTTSAEWRKRHLHQTAEQVEAAKVQAEVLKG